MMAAQPCKECGIRPKALPAQRCVTCALRHKPIGEQVTAARARLAMVPPELRLKRSLSLTRRAPKDTDWCAGCQSWRDIVDFRNTVKIDHTQCWACRSAKSHAAMVAKTYGLTADTYAELLERQDGRCAICRARPKSKRLAVDHDHKTGEVRGLLCSRCNHDLMGSAWDSMAMAAALWHYMNTPPQAGGWVPPEQQPQLAPVDAQRPPKPSGDDYGLVSAHGKNGSGRPSAAPALPVSVPTVVEARTLSIVELMRLDNYLREAVNETTF